jgi:hypothetical protein
MRAVVNAVIDAAIDDGVHRAIDPAADAPVLPRVDGQRRTGRGALRPEDKDGVGRDDLEELAVVAGRDAVVRLALVDGGDGPPGDLVNLRG